MWLGHHAWEQQPDALPAATALEMGEHTGELQGQLVQWLAVILFPPELCITGGKTVLAHSCLICLLFVWEPSHFKKKERKSVEKNVHALCICKEKGYVYVWNRVYIFDLPFPKACCDVSAFPEEMHFVQCVLNVLCTLQVCNTPHTPNALPVL